MSNMASTSTKKTKGRQKVPLKRIENMNNRMVTYSKRKSGLFKKASELCTLCGVQCAAIIMSPAGKPNSFGHPAIDIIVNHFLYGGNPPSHINQPTQNHVSSNTRLMCVKEQLEVEKKRVHELLGARSFTGAEAKKMFAAVESLDLQVIKQMEAGLTLMKNNLTNRHTWLARAYFSQNQNQEPNLSLNTTLKVEQHLATQSIYYTPTMLRGENYNAIHFHAPGSLTFGNTSQTGMANGHCVNPQMMMIPTPLGFINETTLAMRQPQGGNFASSSIIHKLMNAGFPNPNMPYPFHGTTNQIPIQGQYNGSQPNTGMNYVPSTHQSFTSLLMGLNPDVPVSAPNRPSNP